MELGPGLPLGHVALSGPFQMNRYTFLKLPKGFNCWPLIINKPNYVLQLCPPAVPCWFHMYHGFSRTHSLFFCQLMEAKYLKQGRQEKIQSTVVKSQDHIPSLGCYCTKHGFEHWLSLRDLDFLVQLLSISIAQDLNCINVPKISFSHVAHCGNLYLWRLSGPTSCWKLGLR